jgi:hypothetical protein
MKEAAGLSVFEYCRDRISAAFPDHNNNLPLAFLVPGKTAITAICLEVGGLGRSRRDQAQVDFAHFQVQPPSISASCLLRPQRGPSFLRLPAACAARRTRTLGQAWVAGQSQRALALYLVAEHGIGRQMKSFLQLLQRKQSGPFGRRGFKTQMKHPEEIGSGEAES